MAEDSEEFRRQTSSELRNQAKSGGAEERASKSLSEPIHINGGAELSKTATEYDLVMADFYADWCGSCQMLEPIVETTAVETGATVRKSIPTRASNWPPSTLFGAFRRPSCSLTDSRWNDLSNCRTKCRFAP